MGSNRSFDLLRFSNPSVLAFKCAEMAVSLIKREMAFMPRIAIVIWPRVTPTGSLSPVTIATLLVVFRGRKRFRKLTGYSSNRERSQDSRIKASWESVRANEDLTHE